MDTRRRDQDMKNRTRIVGLMAGLVLAGTAIVPTAAQVEEFPRDETLYTSGTQWGPPGSWNPIQDWGYAMGTLGLVYEPLFNYDPLTNEYIPWLAESGEWTSDTEYTIKLREGITWADGEPLTANDVVFTLELGKLPSVPYSTIWNFLEKAEAVDDTTVKVTFSSPQHQQWANFIYNRAIVPQHLWGDRSEEEIMGANENPVGSGPYQYLSHDPGRMAWEKRDGWWGTEALGLDPKPKYIVDIVNGSNNVALGLVLQGGLDMSNNFLPGVATLVEGGYGVKTYYDGSPYMMSANTAWLATNNTKPPLDDPAFRKALATSIDVDTIVNVVYTGIVAATDSTGLLPPWEQYVDQAVVDELGFSYDPEAAKAMLDEAGYVDADGDGFRDNKDGSAIALEIIVPNGWTDWMESIKVISESAKAVGINVEPAFPDYGARTDAIQQGTFDLAIVNDQQLSNTPWTYYNWIFRQPVADVMNAGNFGRYENAEAWDLVQQLDQTPVEDLEGMKAITSQLQTIQLTDVPIIPLWFNGMWSQVSDAVWTNWPSDAGNHFLPSTWRGYWQMGGLRMLDALQHPEPAA
jgi:peptide/nickel transport system substrate-binding protein